MINYLIAISQILLAIGFILFWIYFFLKENKNPERSETYLAFERSFPIPDLGWITPALIISALCLLFNNRLGYFFSITAGGALIFLGLLDISFNTRESGYSKNKSDTIMNLTINLLCLISGGIFLFFGYINF